MGEIALASKNKIALRTGLTEGISGVLGSQTQLLTGEGAPPIADQIRDALHKNLTRVIDLFREWDTNGDGVLSRREFGKGLRQMGLPVRTADANELFDSWDSDRSGTLEMIELYLSLIHI